mmetsp:Transcript_60154/g.144565  ORF Transcript_60154/g.144565 Transcript_60154/m.144565 type:complete len:267 (-) Transcript_60154:67-867(-)
MGSVRAVPEHLDVLGVDLGERLARGGVQLAHVQLAEVLRLVMHHLRQLRQRAALMRLRVDQLVEVLRERLGVQHHLAAALALRVCHERQPVAILLRGERVDRAAAGGEGQRRIPAREALKDLRVHPRGGARLVELLIGGATHGDLHVPHVLADRARVRVARDAEAVLLLVRVGVDLPCLKEGGGEVPRRAGLLGALAAARAGRERVLAVPLARPVDAAIAPSNTDFVAHLDDGAAASLGDVYELQLFVAALACGGLGHQRLGRYRD